MSAQILVLMVPVFFGLMGFAIDLGRLYSARNDLKIAANAMAVAAAQRLIGTDAAAANASAYAKFSIQNVNGAATKYDFGGSIIGEANGNLNSEDPQFNFFDTAASATGAEGGGGGEAGSAQSKYVKVTLHAEAPLLLWRFLSLGQEGKVNLVTQAVAGISVPLCTACAIEPIAIAALSTDDSVDFGFSVGTRYTLGYQCSGVPTPSALANTAQRLAYVLINRYNESATLFPDENSQLYRIGAQGLPPTTDPAQSCVTVNASEDVWANAAPLACNTNRVPAQVTSFLCGLANRFDPTVPDACNLVPETDTISAINPVDTDITDLDDYASYIGTGRRIITIPIVEQVSTTAMTVLGFRQFLLEPAANNVTLTANDTNARFGALYLGSVMPLRQGRFDGCAAQPSGPGKVVLHQ